MPIKLTARTLMDAMTSAPVLDTPIPVVAASVPADARRDARRALVGQHGWTEVFQPMSHRGGCRYGCKLYARRWGTTVRFAVFHSRVYGHR